jgi:uncharacterized membrane protein HdeD (DUF308 family)
MTTSIPSRKVSSTRLLALSVVIMFAGVVVIVAPHLSRLDVRVAVALLLFFTSALHFAFAWPFRPAPAVLWQVLVSIAYGAIGLYLLGHTQLSIDSIRMPLAAWLMIDSLLEWGLVFRFTAARAWLVLDAITTIALAAMVATGWPSPEQWVLAALIGINTFLGGLTRLFVAISFRRAT